MLYTGSQMLLLVERQHALCRMVITGTMYVNACECVMLRVIFLVAGGILS